MIPFTIIFFFLLEFKNSVVVGACLPSRTVNDCQICDYLSYPTENNNLSSTSSEVNFLCLEKNLTLYEKRIFVDSEAKCDEDNFCDGTVEKPLNNLLTAMIDQERNAQAYLESKIEFMLLGNDHIFQMKEENKNLLRLFRRLFSSIKLKPCYCEEYNVSRCLMRQDQKVIISVLSQSIFFFVTHIFSIEGIIFLGKQEPCPALNSSCYLNNSEAIQEKKLDSFEGFFNLESILDNPEQKLKNPSLILFNCEFYDISAVKGTITNNGLIEYGFLTLIQIQNPFGANLNVTNCVFSGGFFFGGLIKISNNISDFYKNIEFKLEATDIASFLIFFLNNTFSDYNSGNTNNYTFDNNNFLFGGDFDLKTIAYLGSFSCQMIFSLKKNKFYEFVNQRNVLEIIIYISNSPSFEKNNS